MINMFLLTTLLANESAINVVLLQRLLTSIKNIYFDGQPLTVLHDSSQSALLQAVLKGIEPAVLVKTGGDIPRVTQTTGLVVLGGVIWQPRFRPRGRVLVVTDNDDHDHVKGWLKILWQESKLADVVVMTVGTAVAFFTFFPYEAASKCGSIIKVVQLEIQTLYPPKFVGDLNGCELSFATEWIMPYVRRGTEEPTGVENLIFDVIIDKLNATAKEMVMPVGRATQVTLDSKGQLTGAALLLDTQKLDLMFSGFTYRSELYDTTDMLTPHTIDSLAWYVPPPQPIPGPTYLYLAFTTQVWMFAAIVMVLTFLCLILTSNTPLTDVVALTLNLASSEHVPKCLLIFCYIYSLHITSTYQASLFMLYSRVVMEKPIETIEEAADLKFVTYIFNYHRPIINLTDFALWRKLFRNILYKDRHNPADYYEGRSFLSLIQVNPVSFYIEEIPVYDEYGPAIMPLKKRFLMCPVLFYMSRGNPLKPAVESITQHLVQGGFVSHWLQKFVLKTTTYQKIVIEGNVTLSFFHLSGAFGILAAGLLTAFVLFVFEHFIFYFKTCRNKMQQVIEKREHIINRRQLLFIKRTKNY